MLTGPRALRDAIAAIGSGHGFIGVDRVAVNFDMWNAVRAWRGQAAANANGRALFGVGAGTPVDRHLTGDESTVFFDARLRIDHRFMARQGRDESLFPIEFYAHRPAVGVKCQSDGNRLDFQATFGAEPAALSRIYEADFVLGHVQRFGDLVQRSKRSVVGDPDRQAAALFIPLGMSRVGLHGRMLDHRHEIPFFEDEIGFFEASCNIAGA